MSTLEDRAFEIYTDLVTWRHPSAQHAEALSTSHDGLREFAEASFTAAAAFAREAARRDEKGELLNAGVPEDEADGEGERE